MAISSGCSNGGSPGVVALVVPCHTKDMNTEQQPPIITTTMKELVEVACVKQSVAVVEQGVEDHQEGHQLCHHPGQ